MKTKDFLKRTVLLAVMNLMALCVNAAIYGGTITLAVGEERSVDANYGGGLTQTGSWSKSNSTFVFVSRGTKTCKIRGNQVGTGTLYYDGYAGAYDVNYYWTVNVVSNSGGGSGNDIIINATNFPDANFRNYLLEQSYGKDGKLTQSEIMGITMMSVSNKNISSLKGIEFFTALKELRCGDNQLTSLDVSKNTALTLLYCYYNQLTSLDVSKNLKLETLKCYRNQLISLDVSKNTMINLISCFENKIKGVQMDAFINSLPRNPTDDEYLTIYRNVDGKEGNVCTASQIAAIKAKGWTPRYYDGWDWIEFQGDEDGITIDDTNFPDANFRNYLLTRSYGRDGLLTETEIKEITMINVGSQNISSLKGIEYFTALTSLNCYSNQLTALDVSKNTALTSLNCYFNQLTALDVSKNTALTSLKCYSNQLTTLDVSKNTALTSLDCSANQLTALDVSKNTALTYLICYSNQLTALDVSKNTALTSLICYSNRLTALDVSKNTALTSLECYINQLTALDISKNTALKSLNCCMNRLAALDISKNTALTSLDCSANQLTALDVSKNTALTYLSCSSNRLTALDVSKNTALTYLSCSYNPLTALDVSKNTALTSLSCNGNQLTALDVSKNTALTKLWCESNQLTALDVSKNTALTYLSCSYNQFTALDVSKNTALTELWCLRNQIKGAAMDALINGLPQNATSETYKLNVYDDTYNDEGNVCTKAQVAAAKAKGWTPYYYNKGWREYEGSDDVEPEFQPGDANGDGSVSAADIVAIVNYIMGTPNDSFTMEAADVNGDGVVNVTDIVAIIAQIMK